MNPIEILRDEHRLIEKVLDALENYSQSIRNGAAVDYNDLRRFIQFIREFADYCHHGKEEDILFEVMVENGFSLEQGPIAVMLAEHDEGRRLVGILSDAAEYGQSWTESDRRKVVEAALGYVELLRHHIKKEDFVLYPAAEANLSASTMQGIGERFEKFEQEETDPGKHEKFHKLAEELISRYSNNSDQPKHHH
ncbi:MAG: hemerythrin domain-containing protein [candidate division Zixibacteria bacterium]|nr:hemerythrin domain-containing protein [candidate division Zixibacteria bacterium]